MLIVFGCVLVNFLGKYLAAELELPLWLDCLGTVFAAYVLGPISGAVVGCTVNIMYSFRDPSSLIYGITSIFIGLVVGLAARKRYFESFFKATSLAGGVAIGSVVISTVFNILLYQGKTGNVWGDGVRDFLMERGMAGILASAVGELYVDFLDKLVTILAVYVLIRIVRRLRDGGKTRSSAAVIVLALLLCAQTLAFPAEAEGRTANEASYLQQVYNADNGLPGHANDVAQTNEGILWIGTNSGLYRYNGSSFRFMEEFDTVKNVNCLYVDQEGRLWIGTNDNGLVLAINGKAVNNFESESGLPYDSVKSIVQSADGDYYVGTSEQIAVVRITIGFKIVAIIGDVRNALCRSPDQTGLVAAVTGEGRLCLLKNQSVLCDLPRSGNGAFSACAFDADGTLWAGTTDGWILRYRMEDGKAVETGRVRCGGATTIHQIYFHGSDTWILAENGIWTLEEDLVLRIDTGDFNSAFHRMAVDYQGHLWFASVKQGLLQLSETSFPNLSALYGLPEEAVNTTCVRHGILYIGTDRGMTAVDLLRGSSVENALTERTSGVAVRCAVTDTAGDLWVCTDGAGLLRANSNGEIRTYEPGGAASVCISLPDGGVAAGGDFGLALIHGDEMTVIPYGDAMGNAPILSICAQSDDSLLLGTDGNGVVVVKDGAVAGRLSKADGLTSGVVRRIVPDGDTGGLFLVTGNSLCYLQNGKITPLNAFPYSDNYDLLLDKGDVFVPGSAGIYVVRRDALLSGERFDYTLLDSRAGFQGTLTENAWNALTGVRDLYLSTERGVVRMNLDTYRSANKSYRLMVSEIKLDGRSVPIERGNGLTFSRDVQSVEFIPEIVNYSLEDPKVSYYLEGLDSGYKTVAQSELTSVVYTNLPSGEYTFHLAIIDEDTGRIREESTYGFLKEKSIHDNSWFLIYLLIVGGIFVGWLTWFITRISLQQTMSIQQERLSMALKQVQMGNETILAIAKTVDAKDVLTSKHSQRVSEYSVLIAKKYGFTPAEQENLRKAALLHDIGKIGIPDSILNKPDRLTDEEYGIMKSHVTRGAEILKDFTLIDHVVEGARYHHERYDGRGYPDGLQGKDIPLYGRIIAIADAFDAMTANRVYRKRQVFPYVMNELHKGRGTQFDPELLDIFLELIDSGEIDVAALYGEVPEENGEASTDE